MDRVTFRHQVLRLTDRGALLFSQHVLLDHPERKITDLDMIRAIRLGSVMTDPAPTIRGDWKGEFFRHAAGERLTVVVVLKRDVRAVVVTAYR